MKQLGVKDKAKIAADYATILAPLKKRFENDFHAGLISNGPHYVNRIFEEIACNNQTFSSTVPVVLDRGNGELLELLGSGVLIRIVNRTFLLTAAHIADELENGTLLIPGKQGFMQVYGNLMSMRLPASGRRTDDIWDIAYFWLDDDCAAELHPVCTVLERPDVSLETDSAGPAGYIFAGFPSRKGNIRDGVIETHFHTFNGIEATAEEYGAIGLTPKFHIAIRFNRKRAMLERLGQVVTAPLPHGMSGGGVYSYNTEALKGSPARLPLIGIVNTYFPDRALITATKLNVFIDCIFLNQPDLAVAAAG